jgi:hypothetical protein
MVNLSKEQSNRTSFGLIRHRNEAAMNIERGLRECFVIPATVPTTQNRVHVSGAPATDTNVHEGRRILHIQQPAPRVSERTVTAAANSTALKDAS